MERNDFEREMLRTNGMKIVDPNCQDYWTGYVRGLRRGFHGKRFGTDEEHAQWWGLIDDEDESRQQRGAGYRAGFRCATER